jgi:hypothetical protein
MATCVICSATTFVSPGYNGTAVKCRMCMHLGPSAAPPKQKKTPEEEMADMEAWGLDVALAHASPQRVVIAAPVPRRAVERRLHVLAKEEPPLLEPEGIAAPSPYPVPRRVSVNHFLAREVSPTKPQPQPQPQFPLQSQTHSTSPAGKEEPAPAPTQPPRRFVQTRFQW